MTANHFIQQDNHLTTEELMINFAKYHVLKALEAAALEGKIETEPWIHGHSRIKKDSILNSYKLKNIK